MMYNLMICFSDQDDMIGKQAPWGLQYFTLEELEDLEFRIQVAKEFADGKNIPQVNWEISQQFLRDIHEKPAVEKPKRKGFVYVMRDDLTNYVKIGFSNNPKVRETTLQAEKPTITLLHSVEGTMDLERKLHKIFESSRIRGEWFNVDADVVIAQLQNTNQ